MNSQKPGKKRVSFGFTLVEILIALIVIGTLAGTLVYTVSRIQTAAADTRKTENAKAMTAAASAIWQANIDTNWASSAAAITALQTGVDLPAPVEGGSTMPIRIENKPNPASYTYTPPDAAGHGPRFDPVLGHPELIP